MHWIALQALPDVAPDETAPKLAPASPGNSAPALADALAALGWWALQFTPHVAQVGQALVLEVSASERLFGGREPLLAHMLAAGQPVGPLRHAQAATSLLALALLQSGAPDSTRPDALPLATLAEAQAHLATLERIGCRRWGDLRALPRGGVVRRFGAPLLAALDRAYGLQPEVYPWLVLPEVFDMPLELAAQVEAAPALLFAARRLLGQLQVWLRARRLGILALELAWEMDARRNTATRGQLLLRTAEPTLDMQHLQRLLGEQLARTTLPAPALHLRMRSLETAPLAGESASLLPDALRAGDSLHQLLERLGARLGPEQVLRAVACADHRPEHMQVWLDASRPAPAGPAPAAGRKRKPRNAVAPHLPEAAELYPTWLLVPPLRLAVRHDRPLYQGPLALLAGPQRLESGWWGDGTPDGHGELALRDYFLARSEQAGLLWIYRERLLAGQQGAGQLAGGCWYLQGLYG